MVFLFTLLLLGGAFFAALGVEDTRYWREVQANPQRTRLPIRVAFWEDRLPSRGSVPSIEKSTA